MLNKIVSGGETGADRGALDAALARRFPCGGYCPSGRRAEDGPIPARYPLEELPTRRYQNRARRNVETSDGTLIVSSEPLTGGTRLTADHAEKMKRPWMAVSPEFHLSDENQQRLLAWMKRRDIEVRNVAGPRASTAPEFHAVTERIVGWLIDTLTVRPRF